MAHVFDGLVGHRWHHWHHWMNCCYRGSEGGGQQQPLPHCWGGSTLLVRGRWGAPPKKKVGLSCGGPPSRIPLCLTASQKDCAMVPASGTLSWCGCC